MDHLQRQAMAMAEECREILTQCPHSDDDLPGALDLGHLLWMCGAIEAHAEEWPTAKLYRWIGFVQCGLIVNRALDLSGVKRMFDRIKVAFAGVDDDLFDHLNPDSEFHIDLGGES